MEGHVQLPLAETTVPAPGSNLKLFILQNVVNKEKYKEEMKTVMPPSDLLLIFGGRSFHCYGLH